ncbi:lysyl-tRNA synthetase [Ascosphaera apis ARSEF 7405]|uniref:Lysyl-tRNA synthetase n=1 Tax=Ascosphaera apis ARSEF 7405 TaxID=392613 RepID=A0A168DMK1_9EURO|nr:lysyl-tRNA synthetase [Ascosphaera apis ARSEF 7405]
MPSRGDGSLHSGAYKKGHNRGSATQKIHRNDISVNQYPQHSVAWFETGRYWRIEEDVYLRLSMDMSEVSVQELPRPARYLSGVSASASTPSAHISPSPSASSSQDKALRIENIKNVFAQPYPRISRGTNSITCSRFREKYDFVESNNTVDEDIVVVHGRVQSARLAGSKLMFFDILHEGCKLQVLCNKRLLEAQGIDGPKFRQFYHALRRGDSFSITGKPHRTGRGELSLLATELPKLLSPCLNTIPIWNNENEDTLYDRHVELLASPSAADVLRARSTIIQTIRQFFLDQSFMEVNTPILASAAGGAVARPFKTHATEFPEETLSLRIAPELWLKRLIVSGFDKVFEIGPSFRNEGIDKTHNPEFTTCEFYQAFADLDTLMSMTEELFRKISRQIANLNETVGNSLTPTTPQCVGPTFIMNHPECLSPLSKSFTHSENGQKVSARAELFIENREVVNLYEEENSPTEQRKKFQRQLDTKDSENATGSMDEKYLEVLEWGLPPTGGWGCGIERLTMLFTGAKRIDDVMSFGNLRSVTKASK